MVGDHTFGRTQNEWAERLERLERLERPERCGWGRRPERPERRYGAPKEGHARGSVARDNDPAVPLAGRVSPPRHGPWGTYL